MDSEENKCQKYLAESRIVAAVHQPLQSLGFRPTLQVSSSLAAANALARRGRWACEQCAMHLSAGTL